MSSFSSHSTVGFSDTDTSTGTDESWEDLIDNASVPGEYGSLIGFPRRVNGALELVRRTFFSTHP